MFWATHGLYSPLLYVLEKKAWNNLSFDINSVCMYRKTHPLISDELGVVVFQKSTHIMFGKLKTFCHTSPLIPSESNLLDEYNGIWTKSKGLSTAELWLFFCKHVKKIQQDSKVLNFRRFLIGFSFICCMLLPVVPFYGESMVSNIVFL